MAHKKVTAISRASEPAAVILSPLGGRRISL